MRLSSLIGHLAELLDAVQSSREPADTVVARFFRARKYLGARDRRFIAEHLFGALRESRLLETVTREVFASSSKELLPARIPPLAIALARVIRAGISLPDRELVALRSLWNVLAPGLPFVASEERYLAAGQSLLADPDPVRRSSLEFSMPEFVVREWIERYGEGEARALCAAMNESAPTAGRVNTLRCTPEECRGALEAEGIPVRRGTFVREAIIFPKRAPVRALKTFRLGWFEMQDEGSQMISLLLNPLPGELVVDVCAGAGGKALHCAALMQNSGRIIAADQDLRRLQRLEERAARAGASIIEIAPGGQVPRSLGGSADAVLVDAPCSGLGTLRRNPLTKTLLSQEASRSYAESQVHILTENAPLVRPGGRLLYATCTLLCRENEEVIERFCAAHPEFTVVPVATALTMRGLPEWSGPYFTLTPHRHGTDGFFGALLRREP
jgi:16S rRNA (cytosine967-C5)-methyltransferase